MIVCQSHLSVEAFFVILSHGHPLVDDLQVPVAFLDRRPQLSLEKLPLNFPGEKVSELFDVFAIFDDVLDSVFGEIQYARDGVDAGHHQQQLLQTRQMVGFDEVFDEAVVDSFGSYGQDHLL